MSVPTGFYSPGPIPVTMLSGFLGAGKTTLLKYILENSTCKIACMVNDLASVNIDAKLVRNSTTRSDDSVKKATSALADMVELANGCACCSAADELFPAFAELIQVGDRSGVPYERIVLENSGVAEPQNIRDSFNEAMAMGHPIARRVELEGMITVVDAVTFIADFGSKAPMAMRPDLGDGGANFRPVVDLLVEQIECSDVVILNKADALEPQRMDALKPIVASLNPIAHVIPAAFGKVPLEILQRSGVASKMNVEAQHRSAVLAASASVREKSKQHNHGHGEGHSHGHHNGEEHGHHHHGEGHEHGHHGEGHEHGHQGQGHDHGHHHGDGHDHSHHGQGNHHGEGHDHAHQGQGHDHHHHHGDGHEHHHHGPPRQTAEDKYGIASFVYLRRKPFHPNRLRQLVLRWLPATHNSALQGVAPGVGDSPIRRVLRSKGFAWLANGHTSAFYWSHAGQHFELREEGDWWVSVDPNDFPPDPLQKQTIYSDFDEAGNFGDRRQEIVFIGVSMDQASIMRQLDEALLTDDEMEQYRQNWASAPDPIHQEMLYYKEEEKKRALAHSYLSLSHH